MCFKFRVAQPGLLCQKEKKKSTPTLPSEAQISEALKTERLCHRDDSCQKKITPLHTYQKDPPIFSANTVNA